MCLTYTNIGSPLSAGQEAANAAYIAGLNSTFGNMALSFNTRTYGRGGIATWKVRYAAAVDYTNYTIYSCDAARTTVYSTQVGATLFNFGAWYNNASPDFCKPYWYWQMANWVSNNGITFFGNLFLNKRTSSMIATGNDVSSDPNGFPFSATTSLYPLSTTLQLWASEISQSLALSSANCEDPSGPGIQAELHTRYGPNNYTWPTATVLPILGSGDLNIVTAVPPLNPTVPAC